MFAKLKALLKSAYNAFVNWGSNITGSINWTVKSVMTQTERDIVNQKLQDDYFIILTRHNGHFSSYVISIIHFFMTDKKGYYGHALMNLEDTVNTDDDFRFVEATGTGVHYSDFNEVFDQQCSSVCLLKPKSMTLDEWTAALDAAKTYVGRPYDTLFDLSNAQALSCVELVRCALQGSPDYATDFANFEKLIATYGNQLDPQMFYECDDFEVVFEVRH